MARRRPAARSPRRAAPGLAWLWKSPLVAAVLLAAVGVAVYGNSFQAPFAFDGAVYLVPNLYAVEKATWRAVVGAGQTRPLAFLSFFVQFMLHGEQPWGYHVVNLAIHVGAALALLGIVRRTLQGPRLAARYGAGALPMALVAALLWLVHPLQTESVTYLYQRYESLMGLGMLLALYCFVRAAAAARRRAWLAASVACCAAATMSKEVAAVTPLAILWYDRVFVAASWRELWTRRWTYYASLASTWALLGAVMLSRSAEEYVRAGVFVVPGVTPLDYAATQPGVILHYLRLAFWPVGQCLDYDWKPVRLGWQVVPSAALLAGLLLAALGCMARRPALGFVLGTFFLLLAPTSSVAPLKDLAFEHRMYLPLASVVVAVVLAAEGLGRRLAGRWPALAAPAPLPAVAGVAAAVVALGDLTWRRNDVYRTELSLWQDVVAQVPTNARAHSNLGKELFNSGQVPPAFAAFERALALKPDYPDALFNRGLCRIRFHQPELALEDFDAAIRLQSDLAPAWLQRGNVLESLHRWAEAEASFSRTIALADHSAEAWLNRAVLRYKQGRFEEALEDINRAVELSPGSSLAYMNRGAILHRLGRLEPALADLSQAIELDPGAAATYRSRAIVYGLLGRLDLARADAAAFLRLGGQADAQIRALLGGP